MNDKPVFIAILLTFALIHEMPADTRKIHKWGYLYHGDPVSVEFFFRNHSDFSVVAMTGFTLSEKGLAMHPHTSCRKEFIESARVRGVSFYPVVTFSKPKTGHLILNDPAIRALCVRALASAAKTEGWTGLHFDFEYLPPSDCTHFAVFLTEIRKAVPKKKLSLAIFPQVDYSEYKRGFHDLKILADKADDFVIMCYDLHGPGTARGPVTDITWSEKNIRAALAYVPAGRLWLGVPAYGYQWDSTGRNRAVSARDASRLAIKYGFHRDKSGNAVVSYTLEGRDHVVYFADAAAREGMRSLAARYGLAGTALWRIGFEE